MLSMPLDTIKLIVEFMERNSPTTKEKLETLVDRIEFIGHLALVKNGAERQASYLGAIDVTGIDWDIDALRVYLALSCVDILSSNFEPFDTWILENCSDFMAGQGIKDYLSRKSKEYRDSFQLSSNFVKAFLGASTNLQTAISRGLSVQKGEEQSSDISRIAVYLYRIRNKYTHEGRRFFSQLIPVDRLQAIGPRDEEQLMICAGFNVVDAVLKIAQEQAVRVLKTYERHMRD